MMKLKSLQYPTNVEVAFSCTVQELMMLREVIGKTIWSDVGSAFYKIINEAVEKATTGVGK